MNGLRDDSREHKTVPCTRPLGEYEHRLLDAFVARLEEAALACQAAEVTVRAECEPGCPTVLLAVARELCPPNRSLGTVPIEASGVDTDGMEIAFILMLSEGYLDEIEIVRGDSGRVIQLPSVDSLAFQIVGGVGR